jgi:hypothetical protein
MMTHANALERAMLTVFAALATDHACELVEGVLGNTADPVLGEMLENLLIAANYQPPAYAPCGILGKQFA